ncbi:4Fe-4S binding protein [Oceanospirillum maris]|uniref:4Fe-4S binding protein n=1 Tax=Oceanospirillum maris TaxID=64977 RepID=UPI0003FC973D|nr:4Fe-4S binding protein [Oceanospirillum maris]
MTAPFIELQREQQNTNYQARLSALEALSRPQNLAAPSISYQAGGHLLIIGADDLTRLAACELMSQVEGGLKDDLAQIKADSGVKSISLLITDAVQNPSNPALEQALITTDQLPIAYGELSTLSGFLGEYQAIIKPTTTGSTTDSTMDNNRADDSFESVDLASALIQRTHFDLVLDLGREPALPQELSPPGYFAVGQDIINTAGQNDPVLSLATVLSQLPDLEGEFEKPLYFRINNDICAHAGRGKTGCTRCLDVCPADAISSINISNMNKQIDIDGYLCHGAGSCSTACPTGAISYGMPKAEMMADYLSRLLDKYRQLGGLNPVLVFHADEQSVVPEQLAANLIPVALEEIASIGMELWLHALNEGASGLIFLSNADTPASLIQLLEREIKLGHQILSAMGYSTTVLSLCRDLASLEAEGIVFTPSSIPFVPLSQKANNEGRFQEAPGKRQRLIANINHLAENAPDNTVIPEQITLSASAPFGQVLIKDEACTLCFSCANICPTAALQTGKETPAILFTEMDCVQCGLCESACPENAITREQRFIFNAEVRDNPRTLYEDEAFCCLDCSKPFAPTSTVNKMKEKLKDHAMFAGSALRRLELCEDCRVKDIYRGLAANPQAQLDI